MTTDRQGDVDLISKCRDESESEIDRRVEILHEINSELPQSKQESHHSLRMITSIEL
jgi:hypothetical protein